MEIERRRSPRQECTCKLSLLLKDREVRVDLRNISASGAYSHVAEEDNEKITSSDTGQVVTFRLTNGKSYVNYKGTINRYIEDDNGNNKYLAVFFHQRTIHELV